MAAEAVSYYEITLNHYPLTRPIHQSTSDDHQSMERLIIIATRNAYMLTYDAHADKPLQLFHGVMLKKVWAMPMPKTFKPIANVVMTDDQVMVQRGRFVFEYSLSNFVVKSVRSVEKGWYLMAISDPQGIGVYLKPSAIPHQSNLLIWNNDKEHLLAGNFSLSMSISLDQNKIFVVDSGCRLHIYSTEGELLLYVQLNFQPVPRCGLASFGSDFVIAGKRSLHHYKLCDGNIFDCGVFENEALAGAEEEVDGIGRNKDWINVVVGNKDGSHVMREAHFQSDIASDD